MHVTDLLEYNARYLGDRVAYYASAGDRTWNELRERSLRLAAAFQGLGAAPGDRVAVLLHEDIEAIETWYACLYAGCLRSGLNPRFTARELADVLRVSQPKLLVVSRALVGVATEAAWLADRPYQAVIVVDRECSADTDGVLHFERAIAEAPKFVTVDLPHDADIAVCFSSGSTGKPKGVIWSNDRLLASMYNCVLALGLHSDDVWLRDLPTFGVGVLMTTWNALLGFPCVLAPRFDPRQQLELIERYGVTGLTGSATTLRRVIDHPDFERFDLTSLRRVMYGQGPASPSVVQRAASRLGCDLVQMYGMTEGHGLFTILTGQDHSAGLHDVPQRLLSAGRPMPHARIKILQDGQLVQPGTIGEIHVSGDSVAKGYYGDPELTADTFIDGWLHTGDLGYVDDDGYLYIVDRKNFMIVTGGYNVYPAEVENVIAECPSVREVAVVGCPHEEWGESVVAVVALVGGADPTAARAEIMDHCRISLAGFKVPKAIEFWDELPMGASGKLLKGEVRNRLIGVHQRSVFGAS